MFGRRAVQILASGMAALLEQRVVVAASGHRLSGRNVVLVDPRPDLAHDVVDVVHVSHRRRVQPQRHLVAARSQEVAVGVDEAGQERVVTQIHHSRGRPFERHHLVHRSGGHDGFATHCDRFHGGTARVHGDDVVAVEDRVRRVGFLSTTRENHGKGERESDKGLIRPAHSSLHACQGLTWAAYACASYPVKPPPSPGSMPLKEQQSPPDAEGVGFEPTVPLPVHQLSGLANSATLAPLRVSAERRMLPRSGFGRHEVCGSGCGISRRPVRGARSARLRFFGPPPGTFGRRTLVRATGVSLSVS